MKTPLKLTIASAIGVATIGLTIAGSSFAAQNSAKGQGDRPQPTAEERATHDAEMKAHLESQLSDAVKDGKLTEDQKSHILDVMNQIHTKMESGDRDGAKKLHDELDTWMSDNKTDSSVVPHRQGPHGSPEEMKTKLTSNLDQAVKNGKLTQDQEKHIMETTDQIHAKMESGDKEGAKTLRDELKTWANDQKIDASIFPGPHPHGPRHDEMK